MKKRLCIIACLALSAGSWAAAMDIHGLKVATLDIANEDAVPHGVKIDQHARTIQIYAGGVHTPLPPRQDIAMRVDHGQWRILGDNGRRLNIRIHQGRDYRLRLQPYVYGDNKVLVGVIDDGYSHVNGPLVDLGRLPHVGDIPPPREINPRHHHHHYDDNPYGYDNPEADRYNLGAEMGDALGQALADALDGAIHHNDQTRPVPVIQQPQPVPVVGQQPWR